MLALLVGGTFATAVVALPLRAPATAAFADPVWVGAALILTGVVVASTRWLPGGPRGERETGWRQAAAIGLAQGLAVFPGLSRSGMTIAAGLGSGLDRTWAAHFSFLLAVPAILAATVVEVADAWRAGVGLEPGLVGACAVGVPCAALTGFVALRFVIRSLSSASFHRFAWYCIPLGLVAVLWGLG
jgi:undecaprenyl-diphosphatase